MRSIDDVLEGLRYCSDNSQYCNHEETCPYFRTMDCIPKLKKDAFEWLERLLWEKRQADKMRKIIRRIIGAISEKSEAGETYYASDVKLMLEDILKELRTYDEGESSQTNTKTPMR